MDEEKKASTATAEVSASEPVPKDAAIETSPLSEPPLVVPDLPDTPTTDDPVVVQERSMRWPVILVYLIAALIVAVLVVFGARWVYHKVHHKNATPTPAPADTNKLPPVPGTTQAPSGNTNPQTGQSAPSKTISPNNGQSNSNTPNQSNNSNLPNNGPGDVVVIFIGTTLAAAGLHFIWQLRREASS